MTTCPRWSGMGAAALMLVTLLNACTAPKPATYPMGQVLPFGSIEMSVHGTEVSSEGSRKSVLVRVTMSNLESKEQARVAAQSWQRWFKLVDRSDKSYKCIYILPTDYYYKRLSQKNFGDGSWADESTSSSIPKEWVLLFRAPLDAQGFTLLIDNATFGKSSQPLSIAVPLDR
jgi:hypothetical protein